MLTDGLKFNVSHEELREHCLCRIEYHGERERRFNESLSRLEGNCFPDREQRCRDLAMSHLRKKCWFRFYLEHMRETTYVLTVSELAELEFINYWE